MTKVQVTNDYHRHIPVMVKEIEELAGPVLSRQDGCYLDATLGRGGHLDHLWQRFGRFINRIVAFDQDGAAILYAQEKFKHLISMNKLELVHSNFSQYQPERFGLFDFILIDLGVSSPQIDDPSRGFSFYSDGPLDMRMSDLVPITAADIINQWNEKDLISLFQSYGEIQSPYRVVRAIVHDRKLSPFKSTKQLAELIERVAGWRVKGRHPATLYFQALRIQVNQELEHLKNALPNFAAGLKPKGRLVVLTFHSLEDRIVKWMFKQDLAGLGGPLFKKVIEPSEEEIKENPRARSAKLRVFERA